MIHQSTFFLLFVPLIALCYSRGTKITDTLWEDYPLIKTRRQLCFLSTCLTLCAFLVNWERIWTNPLTRDSYSNASNAFLYTFLIIDSCFRFSTASKCLPGFNDVIEMLIKKTRSNTLSYYVFILAMIYFTGCSLFSCLFASSELMMTIFLSKESEHAVSITNTLVFFLWRFVLWMYTIDVVYTFYASNVFVFILILNTGLYLHS